MGDALSIGFIGLAALVALIALRMPIAYSMILVWRCRCHHSKRSHRFFLAS